MKILYYDCFAGISGDMNLGAMVDLGVSSEYIVSELSKLNIDGYKINFSHDNRKGIYGTKADVILTHENEYDHEHQHEHEHHHSRNYDDIRKIINNSKLSDNVKKLGLKIFLKVAEAEAKVHGKSIEEVHFHEVGAVDSIVDIIGAAICFDYLKVDKVLCSTVEVGSGFVKCEHGILPVPAPATTEILINVPIKSGIIPFEATTPTGAAILATLVNEFTDKKVFVIKKTGYGIGHKDGDVPNVLRVMLAEENTLEYKGGPKTESEEKYYMMECNIDDMNPELYDFIMERLFNAGAQDVFITPIIMKKGRPAVKFSILSNEKSQAELEKILFTETTTLGLRKYEVQKSMLDRKIDIINTELGEVRVKSCYFENQKIKSKIEYEDCKRIAKEKKIEIRKVYEIIQKNLQS